MRVRRHWRCRTTDALTSLALTIGQALTSLVACVLIGFVRTANRRERNGNTAEVSWDRGCAATV
jgi:hypothetical protein